jgi:hypothetical protein
MSPVPAHAWLLVVVADFCRLVVCQPASMANSWWRCSGMNMLNLCLTAMCVVLAAACQVRKAWMKANLLVHPDKVRQRNGGDEQVAIADMIFDALKEAWGQFRN